jgi:hypothetical protein
LKELQDQADDIVEYTEAMEEFNAYLYQAEGLLPINLCSVEHCALPRELRSRYWLRQNKMVIKMERLHAYIGGSIAPVTFLENVCNHPFCRLIGGRTRTSN